jgi:hypothetical protein
MSSCAKSSASRPQACRVPLHIDRSAALGTLGNLSGRDRLRKQIHRTPEANRSNAAAKLK